MEQPISFEALLARDGRLVYTNKGVSMMPLLRQDRDLMIIEKKGQERCRRFDAVLFRRPGINGRGAYVLHRIVKVNDDGTYYIVGDNCLTGETVREENVLGVLRGVVRDGRTVDSSSLGYRAYVWLWGGRPGLRRLVLLPRRVAAWCWHKVRGR
ncbi:MAG: S24/S26 family peptidase [Oscillospiraceae bacterium]|nr:S24/S26 family peptidase [Oscillospiraceae bacterium]MBR0210765.1 S24/S26 family peptidase [Oscillospiraceae bacterium]